jgi:Fe-Mn family superoxide dismutase
MAFELPPLPYANDALAPHISPQTLAVHHGKHHAGYVAKLGELVAGTDLANLPLVDVIRRTAGRSGQTDVFHNAAQAWNHAFYWQSMRPGGGGRPSGAIAARITADFGSYEQFAERFARAGETQFGSGWAWLVLRNGALEVVKTPNADTPLTTGAVPLLTMDVWEHAYYLDYQNRRAEYIKAFLDALVDWESANRNLKQAGT